MNTLCEIRSRNPQAGAREWVDKHEDGSLMLDLGAPHQAASAPTLHNYIGMVVESVSCSSTPFTLHPASYTLHPTPYTLHPTPYTLHPTPHTLNPTPYTLHLSTTIFFFSLITLELRVELYKSL